MHDIATEDQGNSKLHYLKIDSKGKLLSSKGTLLTLAPGMLLLNDFPLLESILPVLIKQAKANEPRLPVKFEGVSSTNPQLPGFYDYSFESSLGETGALEVLWVITDRTAFYEKMQAEQQKVNERKLKD
ncbi:MAG: hypothetical protein GYB31_11590 [Bacteroidetes bacterium]|nr:hypothetical protein [Bacteroidota bacterium]